MKISEIARAGTVASIKAFYGEHEKVVSIALDEVHQTSINSACKPLVEATSAAVGALAEANLHVTNAGARALLEMARHYCEEVLLLHKRAHGPEVKN